MTDPTTRLCHILVADDEPHIGRIIKMKLEQGPFRVTLVYDGREAVETLERESDICLVLLDLMMPHMSGLDVLGVMRADDRWRDIPCIILTAAGQEQQHTSAMAMGANDFLTKPFSTPTRPKQLLPLVTSEPLLAESVARLRPVVPPERVLILTNESLVPPIAKLLPEIPAANLIAEPRPGGTAAALVWAAQEIARRDGPDATMISVHADW